MSAPIESTGAAPQVQSVARTFALLEAMSELGGTVTFGNLVRHLGLPPPTTHRLVRTLVDLGYVRQLPTREYSLAPRLMRLGEHAGRLLGSLALPHLRALVAATGESANLAVLEANEIVYAAQVPGSHAMRMFTEVGRRAPVHATAVGKAILALLSDVDALALAGEHLPPRTPATITTQQRLRAALAGVRAQGYALDDEEQEIGVRCVAVAVPGAVPKAALSISGPSARMTDAVIGRAVPLLRRAAAEIGEQGPSD